MKENSKVENKAGEPGGSASGEAKTVFLPQSQEEKGMKNIVKAAKELPIPTKDPRWDSTNINLATKRVEHKAPTVPQKKIDQVQEEK